METDGLLDDFYKLHQFKPSKEDAVTYFLPRLLAGTPLPHGADSLFIRNADVYACEPKDLAARYAPVPSAVSTGDRFFFTACRRKSGNDARIARRVAGAGTWTIQNTEHVYHEGTKVGEAKHLSFKKGGKTTGWVMKEYRCLLPEAVVADGEKVLCKIHLAQHAPAAARQESDAYKRRQEPADPSPAPAQKSHKRPAPVAADPPCSKKMQMAALVPEPCPVWVTPAPSVRVQKMWASVPVPAPAPQEVEYEHCPVWFASAAPVSSPAASTEMPHAPEADDDMARLSCTIEELLGAQQQQEQTLPVEAEDFDWESENLLKPLDEEEEQASAIEAEKNNIERIDVHQPAPPTDWELPEDLRSLLADHDEEEALLYKGCNYNMAAADLHASSLQGFFSFGAVM